MKPLNLSLAPVLGLAAVLAAAPAQADSTFKYSGSVRARYESLSGQSRAGFKADDELISFRTILDAEYDTGLWRFGAELYDSRAYLADADSAISTGEVDALEPSQLYVALDLDEPFGKGSAFGAQAGRFQMNVGSRRLISADDYRNTTNSNTGVRVDGKLAQGWAGSAWYVLPHLRLPDDIGSLLDNQISLDRETGKAVLWGALATSPRKLAGGALEAMYLKFKESDSPTRPTRDRDLNNWSLRWYRDAAPGSWDYEFETIVQGGRARTGTGRTAPLRDVDANLWAARAGYSWQLPWKPRLAFEYNWVTGDTGPDKIRRFDTLFGSRRNELAPSGLYNQIARANLDSSGFRLELTPSARSDFMATWKRLLLASRTDAFSGTGVRDASGNSGRYAGQQLDARARYWLIPKQLRFELDTVFLVKGRFLEQAPNARPGDTRFYSLNLTYSF
jgi:alginate export protein